jgi:hypothetical protein
MESIGEIRFYRFYFQLNLQYSRTGMVVFLFEREFPCPISLPPIALANHRIHIDAQSERGGEPVSSLGEGKTVWRERGNLGGGLGLCNR